MDIPSRVTDVRRRIEEATMRSGRAVGAVRLVVVTKYRTVEEINQVVDAGLTDIGENRVQEAEQKWGQLGGRGAVWHLVGHLQSNKVKRAVSMFEWIHSLHNVDLARRVNRLAEEEGKIQRVLLQVDLAGEETKSGLSADKFAQTLEQVSRLSSLSVEGLMALPPYLPDPEAVRPYFIRLRELRDDCRRRGVVDDSFSELSMGMSHDFDVAIEEGATMVRIGTALFGERPASRPSFVEGTTKP
jgi:pyridoxal phosphate enzyme (YggS family)